MSSRFVTMAQLASRDQGIRQWSALNPEALKPTFSIEVHACPGGLLGLGLMVFACLGTWGFGGLGFRVPCRHSKAIEKHTGAAVPATVLLFVHGLLALWHYGPLK